MGRGSKVIFDQWTAASQHNREEVGGGVMGRKQKDSYVSDYRFRLKNCWNPKIWVVISGTI